MKSAYWGYWLILLGLIVIIAMMLINSVTTTTTKDYYQVKEVTQAALVDAVDYGYYREYKELRINKEKFIENFLRRFSETVNTNRTYKISFYDIYEAPPKVSVRVSSNTDSFSVNANAQDYQYEIVNRLDAVLEMNEKEENS